MRLHHPLTTIENQIATIAVQISQEMEKLLKAKSGENLKFASQKRCFCVTQSGNFLKNRNFYGSEYPKWLKMPSIIEISHIKQYWHEIVAHGSRNTKCHNAQYDCPLWNMLMQ